MMVEDLDENGCGDPGAAVFKKLSQSFRDSMLYHKVFSPV